MPDRAQKVLNQIADCHAGKLNDSRFGLRNRGEGKIAAQIGDLMKLAKHVYFKDKEIPRLNCSLHENFKSGQLRLF